MGMPLYTPRIERGGRFIVESDGKIRGKWGFALHLGLVASGFIALAIFFAFIVMAALALEGVVSGYEALRVVWFFPLPALVCLILLIVHSRYCGMDGWE